MIAPLRVSVRTFMSPRNLWFRHLNYAVYIPEPNRRILAVLAEHGVSGMLSEVEKLSRLGSAWASSTLGYLSLLPSSNGKRDPERAIQLCSKAAADGDPYALFVFGWARFILTQDRVNAAEAMLQSARKRFAPAILAMAFFVWPKTEMASGSSHLADLDERISLNAIPVTKYSRSAYR